MKKYRIGFFLLLGILCFIVYTNYDYWIFKILIANNYVSADTLDEFYSQHICEENRRGFFRDFDRVVISIVTAELSEIGNDRFTYLYAPWEFTDSRETDREIARTSTFYALNEDTVYLYIPNISRITRSFVHEHREYLASYPNLVMDLRGNYGGWLPDFRRIANMFVPNGEILNHEVTRHSMFSRTITSSKDASFNFDKIIILQNKNTASAAESLIMALSEHVPNVTTIGQTTFGKGTGQVTIPLTGSYAVRATVLQVLGPVRQNIHYVGIAPDIEIEPDADFIEKVLDVLRFKDIGDSVTSTFYA